MNNEIEKLVDDFAEKKLTRRQLVASLTALAATMVSGSAPHAQAQANQQPVAKGETLNHISLSVTDVNRSRQFYESVLGMEVVSLPGNGGINLGLGNSFLGLYQLNNPGTAHHFCIGVDNYDVEAIAARLRQRGIEPNINRNPNSRTSGGDQLYFNDPDGIVVQLGENGYLG